jgi:hypothetical protein
MDQEIKEIYSLAINCIITGMVLALVMLGVHTKNSFAAAKNDQISRQAAYQEYVKYKVYDDKVLAGDEAITLIREFYNEDGVTIYLDKDNTGASYQVDKTTARQNAALVDLTNLQNRIDATSSYRVWLVYDFYDMQDFVKLSDTDKRNIPQTAGMVTGIALIRV